MVGQKFLWTMLGRLNPKQESEKGNSKPQLLTVPCSTIHSHDSPYSASFHWSMKRKLNREIVNCVYKIMPLPDLQKKLNPTRTIFAFRVDFENNYGITEGLLQYNSNTALCQQHNKKLKQKQIITTFLTSSVNQIALPWQNPKVQLA